MSVIRLIDLGHAIPHMLDVYLLIWQILTLYGQVTSCFGRNQSCYLPHNVTRSTCFFDTVTVWLEINLRTKLDTNMQQCRFTVKHYRATYQYMDSQYSARHTVYQWPGAKLVNQKVYKPVYSDHLMGYFSAFWSSSRWPRATKMRSRRHKLFARVNWYIQSSLKHITELMTGNKAYNRGGRYRQVLLYLPSHFLFVVVSCYMQFCQISCHMWWPIMSNARIPWGNNLDALIELSGGNEVSACKWFTQDNGKCNITRFR